MRGTFFGKLSFNTSKAKFFFSSLTLTSAPAIAEGAVKFSSSLEMIGDEQGT